MQECERAYGFDPRKIIEPQVISVKWKEKKYSGVAYVEGTIKEGKRGMISLPVAFEL